MATVSLPTFNVLATHWLFPNAPPAPPTNTFMIQFYVAPRGLLDIQPNNNNLWQPPLIVRAPKGTAITRNDVFGIAGSLNALYKCRFVEACHLGFTNEYVYAIVEQL